MVLSVSKQCTCRVGEFEIPHLVWQDSPVVCRLGLPTSSVKEQWPWYQTWDREGCKVHFIDWKMVRHNLSTDHYNYIDLNPVFIVDELCKYATNMF